MAERVSVRAILDAVRAPIKVEVQAGGTIAYEGRSAAVVLNNAGRVVTAWPETLLAGGFPGSPWPRRRHSPFVN